MNADHELRRLLANQEEGTRFVAGDPDEEVFHQDDLIELLPFGLSVSDESQRPFLLFKDPTGQFTLPVALNPLEAGVALTQSSHSVAPATPHRFTQMLLEALGLEIKQAVFVQIKGAHQYLRVYLSGHPGISSLKLRADEAMSLCLQLGVPLYATREFIRRSKVMAAEIEGLGGKMKARPELFVKNHRFLM